MKFSLTLTCLFFLFQLTANTLEVNVFAGFCASTENGQARAEVSGGTEPYTFQWSMSNDNSDLVNGLTPGDHSVTVTDATGCEAIEEFMVPTESDIFVDLRIIDITCFGDQDGQLIIDDFFPEDLMFSLDGSNFTDNTVFENLDWGEQNLYVLERNGCVTEWPFSMQEPVPLLVDLGPDIEISLGDDVWLVPIINSPIAPLMLEWNTTAPISCIDCVNVYVYPVETSVVSLIVENANGCIAQDDITIEVIGGKNIFIPNAFTPNRDGFNDVFTIYANQSVARIKNFIIRDNFGSIVYEANNFLPNDPSFGWDGTHLGKDLKENVFIYMVEVEYVDETIEEIFGTVTLLK